MRVQGLYTYKLWRWDELERLGCPVGVGVGDKKLGQRIAFLFNALALSICSKPRPNDSRMVKSLTSSKMVQEPT